MFFLRRLLLVRLFLSVLFGVHAVISSSESLKKREKTFKLLSSHAAVSDHKISTFKVRSVFDCTFACMVTEECVALNVGSLEGGEPLSCELLKPNGTSAVPVHKIGFDHYYTGLLPKQPKSCLDHLKNGANENGIYSIYSTIGQPYSVYCDLKYEPGSAWTLVLSHSMKHRKKREFTEPLYKNHPKKEAEVDWNEYRLSMARMQEVKGHSTHWRVTCSFLRYHVDYRDYVRAKIAALDPMTFQGSGTCAHVELINVRGHKGVNITAGMWQKDGEMLHHESEAKKCEYGKTPESKGGEQNFGNYNKVNKKFRCSAADSSTSNFWFGGYE